MTQVRKGVPKIKAVFSNTFRAIQNAIISYLQFFLKNNPFSLIIQGVNAVARTFKMTELANPFEKMAESLEGLKATIPQVTSATKDLAEEQDKLNKKEEKTNKTRVKTKEEIKKEQDAI